MDTFSQVSSDLETSGFLHRPADYFWQFFLATSALLVGGGSVSPSSFVHAHTATITQALKIPFRGAIHSRTFLLVLAYLHSKLTPPGTQASFSGLIRVPYAYFPYVLTTIDLFTDGPSAAAQDVFGLVVGHVWSWGVFDTHTFRAFGSAPSWLRRVFDQPTGSSGTG